MASRKKGVAALFGCGLVASWLGCSAGPLGPAGPSGSAGPSDAKNPDSAAHSGLVEVPAPTADTDPPKAGKSRFPESSGCVSEEEATGEREKVERRNQAAFHRAVRAIGLRLVDLPRTNPVALKNAEDGPGVGEWALQRVDGSKRILLGPTVSVGCTGLETTTYFAADPSNKIYVVQVKQEQVGEESISVCGCPTRPGGCGPAPGWARLAYELPEGATFGGIANITHPMSWPSIEYAGTNGQPCPPLPPMP